MPSDRDIQKDSLIELIKQGENNTPCTKNEDIDCTSIKCTDCVRESIADYLLANGVIVPPCKAGDTVYFFKAELNEVCPAKVIGIFNNYYTPSMPLWITIEYESKLIGKQEVKMASEVFKILCRYTKEEAEQVLRVSEGK